MRAKIDDSVLEVIQKFSEHFVRGVDYTPGNEGTAVVDVNAIKHFVYGPVPLNIDIYNGLTYGDEWTAGRFGLHLGSDNIHWIEYTTNESPHTST